MKSKSNFHDPGVGPKLPASQGMKAPLLSPAEGIHTVKATPGDNKFKPASAHSYKAMKKRSVT
jgi:hypothetical protein